MAKHTAIQINIPNPCTQSWDGMAPSHQGRFCDHCQKTVIDFTTWSDAALYSFFSKNMERVCGHFFREQLERPINIPYQPHSRLYRITVALGLTLLFTQTPHLLAQSRPPKIEQSAITKSNFKGGENGMLPGSIHGMVIDYNKKEPVQNTIVKVFQGSILKGEANTDSSGDYTIANLAPGYYDVNFIHENFKEVVITGVVVAEGLPTTQNITFAVNDNNTPLIINREYRKPLVDGGVSSYHIIRDDHTFRGETEDIAPNELKIPYGFKPRTFTRDEINQMINQVK